MEGRIKRVDGPIQVQPSIPIIGTIKIGVKDDKGIPRSVDHFVPTGLYAEYFKTEFGENANRIEVVFFDDDVKKSCGERYEIRKGKKLYAWGDGDDFMVYDESTDKYVEMTKKQNADVINSLHKKAGMGPWSHTLQMTFLIPRIKKVFGAWSLVTRGVKSSIPRMVGSFDSVQAMAGTVIGIPFDLMVEMHTSNKPGSKSRYPVLSLVANVSASHLEMVAQLKAHIGNMRGILDESVIEREIKRIGISSEFEKDVLQINYSNEFQDKPITIKGEIDVK